MNYNLYMQLFLFAHFLTKQPVNPFLNNTSQHGQDVRNTTSTKIKKLITTPRVVLNQSVDHETGKKGRRQIISSSEWRGPDRGPHYDPSILHELYWNEGEWVLQKKPFGSTKEPTNCGHVCPLMFKRYGKVCAQNNRGYLHTYDNYCAMKSSDCFGEHDWKLIHRGECNMYTERTNFTKFMGKKIGFSDYMRYTRVTVQGVSSPNIELKELYDKLKRK